MWLETLFICKSTVYCMVYIVLTSDWRNIVRQWRWYRVLEEWCGYRQLYSSQRARLTLNISLSTRRSLRATFYGYCNLQANFYYLMLGEVNYSTDLRHCAYTVKLLLGLQERSQFSNRSLVSNASRRKPDVRLALDCQNDADSAVFQVSGWAVYTVQT